MGSEGGEQQKKKKKNLQRFHSSRREKGSIISVYLLTCSGQRIF